jgi:indole-3-glycerol phosphate synthase
LSILNTIKEHKIQEVRALKARMPDAEFMAICRDLPPTRDFTGAIASRYVANDVALIAEIKRASPTKGLIRSEFDVPAIATAYRDGGAACLSVLTDAQFFQGHHDFVAQARSASGLPVLRKDFIVDPIQVVEARAMQADAILLILAMIDDVVAHELEAAALEYDLDVLIEVHDATELDRALAMKSRLIGINNRDLATFEADLGTSERLTKVLGPDRLAISESGIGGPQDVMRLLRSGIRGFLVGEALMKHRNIKAATQEIVRAGLLLCNHRAESSRKSENLPNDNVAARNFIQDKI